MTAVLTHDGVWLVRDPLTGTMASGRTYADAVAELRRLTVSHTHVHAARQAREGLAV